MVRSLILPILLVISAVLESGRCFLFKHGRDRDSTDAGDRVVHLEPRYWNDPDQLCIEKYCLHYQGKMYFNCLQQFCPAAVLIVPRDIDDVPPSPVAKILGATEFCSDDFLSNNLADNYGNSVDNLFGSGSDVTAFNYGVFNLCRKAFCDDVRGDALYECVRTRCCGHGDDMITKEKSLRKRTTIGKLVAPSSSLMTRQRRVNDEVVQCIESYCRNRFGHARVVCIVKNCNRI